MSLCIGRHSLLPPTIEFILKPAPYTFVFNTALSCLSVSTDHENRLQMSAFKVTLHSFLTISTGGAVSHCRACLNETLSFTLTCASVAAELDV